MLTMRNWTMGENAITMNITNTERDVSEYVSWNSPAGNCRQRRENKDVKGSPAESNKQPQQHQ